MHVHIMYAGEIATLKYQCKLYIYIRNKIVLFYFSAYMFLPSAKFKNMN